jgi:hypothetical protein
MHRLTRGVPPSRKPRPALLLHLLRKRSHRFSGYLDAVATINRSLCKIDSRKDFSAAAFTLDPERHCRLHRLFGTLKAATRDRLLDEVLLLGCEFNLHGDKRSTPQGPIKNASLWLSRGALAT